MWEHAGMPVRLSVRTRQRHVRSEGHYSDPGRLSHRWSPSNSLQIKIQINKKHFFFANIGSCLFFFKMEYASYCADATVWVRFSCFHHMASEAVTLGNNCKKGILLIPKCSSIYAKRPFFFIINSSQIAILCRSQMNPFC